MVAKKPEQGFQEMRTQLDEVLLKLQDPDCDVDEAVELYEQALKLVAKLEQHLQTAENRIQKIKVDFGLAGSSD
jgi:exodeoxyribonuclease VII small subunit